jgi:hypothetical protein
MARSRLPRDRESSLSFILRRRNSQIGEHIRESDRERHLAHILTLFNELEELAQRLREEEESQREAADVLASVCGVTGCCAMPCLSSFGCTLAPAAPMCIRLERHSL